MPKYKVGDKLKGTGKFKGWKFTILENRRNAAYNFEYISDSLGVGISDWAEHIFDTYTTPYDPLKEFINNKLAAKGFNVTLT